MGLLLYPPTSTREAWTNLMIFDTLAPCPGLVQKLLEKQHGGKAAGEAKNLGKAFSWYGLSGGESHPAASRSHWVQKAKRGSRGGHRRSSRHPSTSLGAESPNPAPLRSKSNPFARLVKLPGSAPPANLSAIADLDFVLASVVNVRGKRKHVHL